MGSPVLRVEGDRRQLCEITAWVAPLSSRSGSLEGHTRAGERLQPCLHGAAPVPMHPMCWWCRAEVGDHLLVKASKLQGCPEGG